MTEEAILQGCIKNNPAAQKALYQKYSAKMLVVCYRYAHNREDAEDMLQEGFIKVFLQIHTFESRGSFEGWVRRVFINSSIEHYRKKQAKLTTVSDKEENTIEDSDISALDSLAERDQPGFCQFNPLFPDPSQRQSRLPRNRHDLWHRALGN